MSKSGEESALRAGFSDKAAFGPEYYQTLTEQYKAYVDSSNKVSERRAGAQTFLLTANTLLVTIYSLAAGKDVIQAAVPGVWKVLTPIAGLAMCVAWFALIRSYRLLNAAKFQVINEIEARLPAQLFRLEWDYLESDQARGFVGLSRVEQWIPIIFGLLYLALIAVARGWA